MILQVITDTIGSVVNEVVSTSIAIHENTGGGQILNGVDNTIIGSLITLIVTGIIRAIERRRLIKKIRKENE
jgi:uncharacterized membrane protein YeaQ/YmgE (transglycosylase-associated protein family)